MKRLFFCLSAALLLSGCGLLRQITGSQVRVFNDSNTPLSYVTWSPDVRFEYIDVGETTDYISTDVTAATIWAQGADPGVSAADTGTWTAEYAGVYTIRVFNSSPAQLAAEIIADDGTVDGP